MQLLMKQCKLCQELIQPENKPAENTYTGEERTVDSVAGTA